MNTKKVKEIALKIREATQRFATPAKQRMVFGDAEYLSCFCAIASHALLTAYKLHGIEAKMVIGDFKYDNHCWVEIGNMIVDITVSQFHGYGEEKVFITNTKNRSYEPEKVFSTYKDLEMWEGQCPKEGYTKRILKYAGFA